MGVTFKCIKKMEYESTKDNIAYSAIHRFRLYFLEAVLGKEMAQEFEEKVREELLNRTSCLDDWIQSDLYDAVSDKDTPEAWGVFYLVNCSDSDAVFDHEQIPSILAMLDSVLKSGIVQDDFDCRRLEQIHDVFDDAKYRMEDEHDSSVTVEMY